ncbi:MAG: hypothetical protein JNM84_20435 [Planctomycetes bacterium]|nr:hypothetical protein [Planctomycetota bacterium]
MRTIPMPTRTKTYLACLCLVLLAPALRAQSNEDDPEEDAPAAMAPEESAAPDEPDFHPNEVRTMRPKIWDEPPEANGLLTTSNAVIPAGLSLGRARRVERAQVDPDELADRQERMLDGERFTQRLRALASEDDGREARSEAEVAEARAGSEKSRGSSFFTIVGGALALGGFLALLWTKLRAR